MSRRRRRSSKKTLIVQRARTVPKLSAKIRTFQPHFKRDQPGLLVNTRAALHVQTRQVSHIAQRIPLAYSGFQKVHRVLDCENKRSKIRQSFFAYMATGKGKSRKPEKTDKWKSKC